MKLTVKLFAGLTAFAVMSTALFGSISSSSAADGAIYVTNVATKATNESPAPTGGAVSGRASAATVYVTTERTSGNLIQAGADALLVRAYAPGANIVKAKDTDDYTGLVGNTFKAAFGGSTTFGNSVAVISGQFAEADAATTVASPTSANVTGKVCQKVVNTDAGTVTNWYSQSADDCFTGAAGGTAVISLSGEGNYPMVGTSAEVIANTKIYGWALTSAGQIPATAGTGDASTDLVATGKISITGFYAGNPDVNPAIVPWVSIQVNQPTANGYVIDKITFNTSRFDVLPVTVSSELTASANMAVTLYAEETTRNSGIFEGFVQVLANESGNSDASSADGPNTNANVLDGVPTALNGAAIRSGSGPVTFSFLDGTLTWSGYAVTGTYSSATVSCAVGSASCPTRTTTASLDTVAPSVTLTSPVNGSYTQTQTLTFTGSFADDLSGLDVSSAEITYNEDGTAAVPYALSTATTNTGTLIPLAQPGAGNAQQYLVANSADLKKVAPTITNLSDGLNTLAFSLDPTASLPVGVTGAVEKTIKYSSLVSDMAGNLIVLDGDTSTSAATTLDASSVVIDTTSPALEAASAITGRSVNSSGTELLSGTNTGTGVFSEYRNKIRIALTDKVQGVEASDFTVTTDGGAVLVPSSVEVVNTAGNVGGTAASRVYLTMSENIASNDTPKVKIVGSISDLAGNTLSTGELEAADALPPVLTVTVSGGSGGDAITKKNITVTVVSDETVGNAPTVEYDDDFATDGALTQAATSALSQGNLTWTYTFDTSAKTAGVYSVRVKATAAAGTSTNGSSTTWVGTADNTTSAAGLKFTLDKSITATTFKLSGAAVDTTTNPWSAATSQGRPVVQIDFGSDPSTVTIGEALLVHGSTSTNITSQLVKATAANVFYWVPASDLAASTTAYKLTLTGTKLTDSTGNVETTDRVLAITVSAPNKFTATMYAGWNAVSFPSAPVDADLNTVFDNAAHDAVLGFDSGVPGQWRIAVRDSVSGKLVGATENGLSTVSVTQAYWVHSTNFDPVKVYLTGAGASSGSVAPALDSIAVTKGFNAVPVVDPTKATVDTFGAAVQRISATNSSTTIPVTVKDYLGSISYGRVYKYNAAALRFEEALDTLALKAGDVLFVEVKADGTIIP